MNYLFTEPNLAFGGIYTSIVTRRFFAVIPFVLAAAQEPKQPAPEPVEPPEEDEALQPKEYSFNPLQAENEIKVGNFYMKKGSYRAAARRYEEATRWNPGMPEAFLKWGEALEKLKDRKGARGAYAKYLELAPDGKEAESVRKKLAKKS